MTESIPYEAYKTTRVSWLPRIPEHWALRKNKYIFSEINERSETGNEELLALSKYYGLIPRSELSTEKEVLANSLIGYKICDKRDMVLNKLQAWNGILDISKYNGLVSPDYSVYRIKIDISVRFLFYLFRTRLYISEFRRNSSGVGEGFFRLYSPEFFNISSIVPPLSEQRSIADFLDHKTARIDNAVSKKKQLIALLHEQKEALINRVITKGLEGKTDHWERKKLKYVAAINPSKRLEMSDDDEVVFLPMEKVSVDGIVDCSLRRKVAEVKSGFTYFRKGDVILAKITPCFENGKGANLSELETLNGFGSTEFHVLRHTKSVIPEYLYSIIHSEHFKSQGENFMIGSAGQKRVPTSFVANFSIGIPPLTEQAEIVAHIETENQKIDTTVSRIEQEIELLKEYRTTLIASAVTGKINVLEKVYALQN